MKRQGAAVLLLGETGSGKGRVAEEIHRRSGRASRRPRLRVAARCAPVLLALSLAFGCSSRDDVPPEPRLPFTLEMAFSAVDVEGRHVEMADLNGDGWGDLIVWNERHLTASDLHAGGTNLADVWAPPGERLFAWPVAVEGAAYRHLGVAYMQEGAGTSTAEVRCFAGPDARAVVHLPPYPAQWWLQRGGGDESRGAILPWLLIRGKDGTFLLCFVNTGYFGSVPGRSDPRAVVAYSWPSGDLVWQRPMGPLGALLTPARTTGDSAAVVLVTTYSPNNGAFAEGTADSTCYVFAYGLDGGERWRMRVGGVYTRSWVLPVDLDADGRTEVLVASNSNAPGAPPGSVVLADLESGAAIAEAPWRDDVWSIHWRPDLIGKRPGVIASTKDGEVLLLAPDLSIHRRRRLGRGLMPGSVEGVVELPGGRGPRLAGVYLSAERLRLVGPSLETLAVRPATESLYRPAVVAMAGRPAGIMLQEGRLARILLPRRRGPAELAWGHIRTRPVEGVLLLAALAAASVLVRRTRRLQPIVFERELARCALDFSHRGKVGKKIGAMRRALREIEAAPCPETLAGAVRRFAPRARYWRALGGPRVNEFAATLRAFEPKSRDIRRLENAARVMSAAVEAAIGSEFEAALLLAGARTAASSLEELHAALARCRALAAPHITADPGAEWQRVIEAEQEDLAAYGVEVAAPAADGSGRVVMAPIDLRRLYENLVDNACRGMAASPERRLLFAASAADHDVVIEIGDTGPGVPPELQAQLAAGKSRGTGYRLIRSMLETYHGRLEFASGAGAVGTRVRVTLCSERLLGQA